MNLDKAFNLLGLIVMGTVAVRIVTNPRSGRTFRAIGDVFNTALRRIG